MLAEISWWLLLLSALCTAVIFWSYLVRAAHSSEDRFVSLVCALFPTIAVLLALVTRFG